VRTDGTLALTVLLLALAGSAAAGGEPKRVLLVHSFGSSAPPFTTHSTAFETALTKELGSRVDLDQVSLDMARYAQPDMEGAFVEFLLKRLAKWHPDLVVPIGSPAGRFVVKFRDRLFPGIPVIYTGMDRRTVAPEAITKNATFVGEDFKLAGLVEDILQLAPDTTTIEVILGATPLERYWAGEFRRAFEPFTDRVTFNFLNDLSFDQMLGRLSTLPPRSFILLGLFLRDASGVTHNEDEALQRLHAVANAPINGLYQNQLGLGIVGGRLYQGELQGVESARIAARILRGEPMASFPPMIIGTQRPRYDWRELQRWNIGEDRLPPGSVVEFRQPTVWQRYRWWVLGTLCVALVQAGLILQLALNLTKRRRGERALRESEARFRIVADSVPVLLWMSGGDRQYTFFNKPWMDFTGRTADEEIGNGWLEGVHPDDVDGFVKAYVEAFDSRRPFGLQHRLRRHDGEYRWVSDDGVPRYDAQGVFAGYVGSCLDITERRRAEQALRESHETILNLAGRLITAQEEERRRLGRDLHDDVSQRLAALGISLSVLARRLPETREPELGLLRDLQGRARELSDDVRRLSHDLHPAVLEHAGLGAALETCCQDFSRTRGIDVRLTTAEGDFTRVPMDVSLGLYRVVQEALANVARHSGAKRAEVRLRVTDTEVDLQVIDVGKGFNPDRARRGRGLGLISMQERVRLLRGAFEIRAAIDEGTDVRVHIPI
jgi:PAS domain S-box-containing protein